MTTDHGPTPAERARTVLAGAAVLAVDFTGRAVEDVGVHGTAADGFATVSRAIRHGESGESTR